MAINSRDQCSRTHSTDSSTPAGTRTIDPDYRRIKSSSVNHSIYLMTCDHECLECTNECNDNMYFPLSYLVRSVKSQNVSLVKSVESNNFEASLSN